jgi:hypothetical protein
MWDTWTWQIIYWMRRHGYLNLTPKEQEFYHWVMRIEVVFLFYDYSGFIARGEHEQYYASFNLPRHYLN